MRGNLRSALICSAVVLAAASPAPAVAQAMTELEAKMFSASNSYEQ